MGLEGIGQAIERHPLPALALALAGGAALYVYTHGGKLDSLSLAGRGLKGQVSNQELLGVATDTQPTDAQGYADITYVNDAFAALQKRIDEERALREAQAQQLGGNGAGGY